MIQYRFITPRRRGKWYADLREAQRQANVIGAGFLDHSGNFVTYRGTVLELRAAGPADVGQTGRSAQIIGPE